MGDAQGQERFIGHLTACQSRLYAYIFSLVGDANQAQDVLQETNLVLWRRSAEFTAATDFATTACRIAYYQVLAFRRDRKRDKLLFCDVLVEQLAEVGAAQDEQLKSRQRALRKCLGELPEKQRELICTRYAPGVTTADLAQATGRSVGAMDVAVHRIRKLLLDCIVRRLAQQGGHEHDL